MNKKFMTMIAITAILCLASSLLATHQANAIGYQSANNYIASYPSLYWSNGCDASCSDHNLFHDKAYNAISALEQLNGQHGLNYGHLFAKYGWSSSMISTVNTSYGQP